MLFLHVRHYIIFRPLISKSYQSVFHHKAAIHTSVVFNQYSPHNAMDRSSILRVLEDIFPSNLADDWDNTGLLIEPAGSTHCNKLMLTNDLTIRVVQEAISTKTDFIVAYHPPIFHPLKRITQGCTKEKIVSVCLKDNITVYSPHTSADKIRGGVNDWLIEIYGPLEVNRPISVGADKCEDIPLDTLPGAGRFCQFPSPLKLVDVIALTKANLDLKHIRVAVAEKYHQTSISDISVSTLGVCAGSGSSVLRDVAADVYLTGEMSHHELLDATSRGVSVILCEHSNSERGYLGKVLRPQLQKLLNPRVEVFTSHYDRDPVEIV